MLLIALLIQWSGIGQLHRSCDAVTSPEYGWFIFIAGIRQSTVPVDTQRLSPELRNCKEYFNGITLVWLYLVNFTENTDWVLHSGNTSAP